MRIYREQGYVDGRPTFPKPVLEIASEVPRGGALVVFTADEYITEQQRKWWKGVLIPALVKDSGTSFHIWERDLKFAVMPDKFAPELVSFEGEGHSIIPSITILTKNQMSKLIEGSVAQLHEWGFLWVTLPDADLRR